MVHHRKAWTTFISDLRLDAGEPCEARNPVRAAGLALIQQVIVQLAIAVDLAAYLPGLPKQRRLAGIVTRPPAH